MESPFLQPGFLLALVSSLIGFISWLVKLERRNGILEKEVVRIEAEKEKNNTEFVKSLKELRQEVESHRSNGEVHFNQKVSEQVDKRNELRFQTIETHITEMKQMLQKISDKQ